MKLLQINCVYPKGSTGKLTQILHRAHLGRGEPSVVLYGRGEKLHQEFVYKTCPELYSKLNNAMTRLTGVMYGGCWASTWYLISLIQRERPDVVHLQCINGYFVNIYALITWLKRRGIPTVLTLHAEFMYTANCGHALDCDRWRKGCGDCPRMRKETGSIFFDRTAASFRRMKAAFDGFDNKLAVVSVSPWLMDRAKRSLILGNRQHFCINNGVDTSVFRYITAQDLRAKLCGPDEKMIIHATASFTDDEDDLKGGCWLIRLAERMKDMPVRFVVAGSHHVKTPLPPNVTLLGRIEDQSLLAQYYAAADLTVLVSKKETFSMIAAESLCCGTPVVGFMAGAPEQIALETYSSFVGQGDLDALETAVEHWLSRSPDKQKLAQDAAKVYSCEAMVDQYEQLYRRVYEGK